MTHDGTIVDCPVSGCEYSGPRKSVAAHYSGKRDEQHKGGVEKAKALIADSMASETNTDTESDTQVESQVSSQSSNPLKDGPASEDRGGSSEDTCPECGATGDTSEFSDGEVIVCEGCGTELVYHE